MGDYNVTDRQRAINRGMEFLCRSARDEEAFDVYGYDYLCCFYGIASTSRDPLLREKAVVMGRECARRWRRRHCVLPADADADTISEFVLGSDAADRLGLPDESIKSQIRRAAGEFTARDYFWFDPAEEPPPANVPNDCDCGATNRRGRTACQACSKRLTMLSRYDVWLVALIRTYKGARYGVDLGARYSDALKWLPTMRPYPQQSGGKDNEFYDALYAISHVVYTLSDYCRHSLSPSWLPAEFDFLRSSIRQAIAMEDPDMVGECLDSLKSFKFGNNNPFIRDGVDFLISRQNPDGSWGDTHEENSYERYHPTWAAIDGLRDYRRRRESLSFPELMPLLGC